MIVEIQDQSVYRIKPIRIKSTFRDLPKSLYLAIPLRVMRVFTYWNAGDTLRESSCVSGGTAGTVFEDYV